MSFASFEMLSEKVKRTAAVAKSGPIIIDDDKFKLSFAFQNLTELTEKDLPPTQKYEEVLILDLTENNFTGSTDLRFLFDFPNLKTLILDKNQIQSKLLLPYMEKLTTLWLNHNKVENLSTFIECLAKSCPNLTYLSMLNNPAAPSFFNGGSLIAHNDYRLYVISKLAHLKMLDHKEISPEERIQSQAIYGAARLAHEKKRSATILNRVSRSDSVSTKVPEPPKEENKTEESTPPIKKSSSRKKSKKDKTRVKDAPVLQDDLSQLPDILTEDTNIDDGFNNISLPPVLADDTIEELPDVDLENVTEPQQLDLIEEELPDFPKHLPSPPSPTMSMLDELESLNIPVPSLPGNISDSDLPPI